MPQEEFEKAVESGPMGKWFIVNEPPHKNVYVFKQGTVRGMVYPNIEHFGKIKEWQSSTSRVESGVRVEGPEYRHGCLDSVKKAVEDEVSYQLTITIPFREVAALKKKERKLREDACNFCPQRGYCPEIDEK